MSDRATVVVDSPLNSYVYVHWILDFKQLLLLLLVMGKLDCSERGGDCSERYCNDDC